MKVYAVARWDNYYPSEDNVTDVFTTMEAAKAFLDSIDKTTDCRYDNYDIFVYDVKGE